MLRSFCLGAFGLTLTFQSNAQLTNDLAEDVLVGYVKAWQGADLQSFDDNYNVLIYSFALPSCAQRGSYSGGPIYVTNTVCNQFAHNHNQLLQQVAATKAEGKVALISVGGANHSWELTTDAIKNAFITNMNNIIQAYGFQGMDINLEGQSIRAANTTRDLDDASFDVRYQNMIDAIRSIAATYEARTGKDFILSTAPEAIYVQGGIYPWGGVEATNTGCFLPFLKVLDDELDLVHVQLYNSGPIFPANVLGLANSSGYPNGVQVGTQDFVVAMTEMLIRGFRPRDSNGSTRESYPGLDQRKVVIGLPAGVCSAGSGYIAPAELEEAIKYLRGQITKPAGMQYSLLSAGGYPNIRGMMTWSANEDATWNCSGTYTYANTYDELFPYDPVGLDEKEIAESIFSVFPNPAKTKLTIELISGERSSVEVLSPNGQVLRSQNFEDLAETQIDVTGLDAGIYYVKVDQFTQKLIIE